MLRCDFGKYQDFNVLESVFGAEIGPNFGTKFGSKCDRTLGLIALLANLRSTYPCHTVDFGPKNDPTFGVRFGPIFGTKMTT